MAALRSLLQGLHYTRVATLLNSGNAVFDATAGPPAKHAVAIAAAIASTFKMDVPVVVKSAAELDAIISDNPIEADGRDHSRLLVILAQDSRRLGDLEALASLVVPPEQFVVGQQAAYLLCANGILDSKVGQALLGKVGSFVTTRNLATLLKLQNLANESAD